ncbi:hypothetical protein MRB53_040128 [Persea americana]|nr:hypothetical protein MRB53_040128 [Persea americana]
MNAILDNYNFNDDLDADLTFEDQVPPLAPLQDTRDDKPTISPRAQKRKLDLDIFGDSLNQPDAKIRKQRDPIPKLDADKLLSDPGIPKLRKMVRDGSLKKNLRLKEKAGHGKRMNVMRKAWIDEGKSRGREENDHSAEELGTLESSLVPHVGGHSRA